MTNMNEMMNKMMEGMMEKMMETMMTSMMNTMMNSMTPQVAPAEVEAPKKAPQTLSRADFLALEEEVVPVEPKEPIDFRVLKDTRTLVFNQSVSKDIWTINYLELKDKYPNMKYDKNTRGFRWNKADLLEFRTACQSYEVITSLTDDHKTRIDNYRKEKARKRAEYYANLAK
jgi:hypothetical protein